MNARVITVRLPRRSDINAMVENMRPLDRQEIQASSGDDIHEALRRALSISTYRYAAAVDGELAMLGGVTTVSLLGGVGSPWLLGTTLLDRVPGALTRGCMGYLEGAKKQFPILVNYVDARNVKAIRWLKRLGFTISDSPVPYGPKGLPFYKFELRS